MNIIRGKSLSREETEQVWLFLKDFDYIPYQQFPEYPSIEGLGASSFIAKEGEKIIGWVQVIEKKNILASVEFGPIANNSEVVSALLLHILGFYKKRLFLAARWMPFWYKLEDYDRIRKEIEIKYKPVASENLIHWSSKRIGLEEAQELILKKFSENHRRNIKKAAGFNIECRVIASEKEVKSFITGYVQMYRHRKLKVDEEAIGKSFAQLHEYLMKTGRGFFMGAFKDDILLGGLIIIYQGNTAFYHKGFIDHEQRQMPINHVAFYQAILHSRENNMSWFDFGGYAVDTTDEQLVNINKFKDGFKGELVSFPPSRIFGLNLLSKMLYAAISLKNKILRR